MTQRVLFECGPWNSGPCRVVVVAERTNDAWICYSELQNAPTTKEDAIGIDAALERARVIRLWFEARGIPNGART